MNISKKQMDEVNKIQLEIFKEFIKVCDTLKLEYFLVHGSLLGAIKYKGFFPYDDDIDVAMPRKDYDILIKEGQKLLKNDFFLQSNETEKDYPLVFAKLRNSKTAFIQPILKGLNVNKGIYIDIFPIDNYPKNKISILKYNILEKIYRYRIISMLNLNKSIGAIIISNLTKIIVPNKYTALKKLNNLYANVNKTGNVILYGGKKLDRGVKSDLFSELETIDFEGIKAVIPTKYDAYLRIIYGEYETYSPSEKYMKDDDLVEVSAEILDTKKSYKEYETEKGFLDEKKLKK